MDRAEAVAPHALSAAAHQLPAPCQEVTHPMATLSPTARSTAPHCAAAVTPTDTTADAGRLLLRLSVAGMMLLHGLSKVLQGPGSVAGLLEKSGLPPALAYGAYLGEVLAPLLVMAGVWTRPAALVMAINMVVAIALAHGQQVFMLNQQGGWAIELQAFYLFGSLAVALLGAGRWSLGGVHGRWY